ncbi:MAG: NTP transferase domain-containing protein, partial [Chitinophagales bacterium]|nr:NTP transferase domain-containing protein [Chitinophagales bacterium]MDW8274431.1 NTP transferase domain-containing protein [Chitinophagales bacterium]
MKTLGIIPARYNSVRLPGKPLADIAGKPMIQRVYERSVQSNLDDVVVATDDQRIFEAVLAFGGKAIMTSKNHFNGTSRVAEAACNFQAEIILNIQGDEPFIEPVSINLIVG